VPRARASAAEPVQEFFSIGEVCQLTDLKPHVLRYWESQFRILSPAKNRSGNRVYARREVELVLLVKHLLYTEKFTIDGARQRLEQQKRSGELRAAARSALATETIALMERELRDIVGVLEGRIPPGSRTSDPSRVPLPRLEPAPLELEADDAADLLAESEESSARS
jgi:DNA-binding transcriptional MerR regulator